MATRPPRLKRPHTYFHVTSRGTNRWNVFLDDADRVRFLFLLAAVCDRHGIEVHAYCLMGNHFHLVLYCPEPTLSAAMRDLKSRYAKSFNRRHGGSGPVFEAPFVEVPILDDEHLKIEIRYSHRNPLDLDPNACLSTYPWSSHRIYLGLRPCPRWLQTRIGHELFGPDYRNQVEQPRPTDKVQNMVGSSVHSPGDFTLETPPELSLAAVLRLVAVAAGCDIADVQPAKRNGLVGVAVVIASDIGAFTAAEIAEPFGYKSAGAVHMAKRRARVRLNEDPELQAVFVRSTEQIKRAA